jgi:hypothetical protein
VGLALVTEPQQETATWDDFWMLYPRRVAKKDAQKAWAQMTEAQRMAAIVACVSWRPIWMAKDVEFLPYPASWLRGERWEDELPSSVSHASHVTAKPQERERGEMPAHVKALLAKMRKP